MIQRLWYATTLQRSPLKGSTQCSSRAPLNLCHFRFSVMRRSPLGSFTTKAPPVNGPKRAIADWAVLAPSRCFVEAKLWLIVTSVAHGNVFLTRSKMGPLRKDWLSLFCGVETVTFVTDSRLQR